MESYISKLLQGESGISNASASLIEEKYGYFADWILNETEPKMRRRNEEKDLTPLQRKVIFDIEQMDASELAAVRAFIQALGEYKKAFGVVDR